MAPRTSKKAKMAPEQQQALTEKMTGIEYPAFDVRPGQEDILMLHVDNHFICGVEYALTLSDDQLKSLIDVTVAGGLG